MVRVRHNKFFEESDKLSLYLRMCEDRDSEIGRIVVNNMSRTINKKSDVKHRECKKRSGNE